MLQSQETEVLLNVLTTLCLKKQCLKSTDVQHESKPKLVCAGHLELTTNYLTYHLKNFKLRWRHRLVSSLTSRQKY